MLIFLTTQPTELPKLDISDWIQVIAITVSLIVGVISIYYTRIAIQQSSKANQLTQQSIEDMAKPFVNVYVDAFAVKSQQRVFTFKNFGQTPAYIEKIEINGNLDKFNKYAFQSLVGNMLAPGQKITSYIDPAFKEKISISISYKDMNGKLYSDTFNLDPQIFEDFAYSVNESNKSDEVPTAIRQSTMALLRDLKP